MNNIDEIDEKFDDLQTILHSSKEFSFEDGTILKLRQYYGNKEVYLDLSKFKEINIYFDVVKHKSVAKFLWDYKFSSTIPDKLTVNTLDRNIPSAGITADMDMR